MENFERSLLSVDELAKSLNLPKSWIYSQTRQSKIPFKKLGKYVRFDPVAVAAWLDKQARGAAA